MKVLLATPAMCDSHGAPIRRAFEIPQLSLPTIAALTPQDWQVKLINESFTPLEFSEPADLVGISCLTPLAPRAYELADAFRARGRTVVLGGIHPSACPTEAKDHADSIVIGEAEGLWPRLLEDWKHGQLQPFYRHERKPSLRDLPWPRMDLHSGKIYFGVGPLQATRGCPYDCSFCSVSQFFGRSYRFRPVEEVLAYARKLPHSTLVFIDDNIVANPQYAKRLFLGLKQLGKKWGGQASLTMLNDPELIRLMIKSGCIGLFIGFESISDGNLQDISKPFVQAERYGDIIRMLHDNGVLVLGAFVFGFDGDDLGVFERTVSFAIKNRIEAVNLSILTPYPGTRLRNQLLAEGRIFDSNWAHYTEGYVVFHPKKMSPEQLQQGYAWAKKEFYSWNSIIKRTPAGLANPKLFLGLNLFYRHRAQRLWREQPRITAVT